MPVQYLSTYSPVALIAMHTALLSVIDSDSNPGSVTIHDDTDTLLAEIPLAYPGGSIDPVTGILSINMNGSEESAPGEGTPNYGTLRNGLGEAIHSLPCQLGNEAVAGKCVINTEYIEIGGKVDLVSWIIGE